MCIFSRQITLNSPDETALYASKLGEILKPGDAVLLNGSIGAGKTHFARHLIQSLMDPPEDVPSPTYTLIQIYETSAGQIQHADLYRLNDTQEIAELGLIDAFETDICLVEWPDRLGDDAPASALTIALSPCSENDETRTMTVSCDAEDLAKRLADYPYE